MNIGHICSAKSSTPKRRLAAVTCYDAAFARLIRPTNIDIVLVGDSVGNVVLGFENTVPVTMEHMLHHTAAVARGIGGQLLVADMPFLSYASAEQALTNAGRLMQAGAQAVKLEGGHAIVPQIKALVQAGIPVMGHLGLTPQSIYKFGGHKVQGRDESSAKVLITEALELEDAGAFAVVLELVKASVAKKITNGLAIPTIGIGAGRHCDGQILVLHDLLGLNENFQPKFLKKYADLGRVVREALETYSREVKGQKFPEDKHSFEEEEKPGL